MVEGLDRFSGHFAAYADQYVLIGGAACTLVMEDVGQAFRATKDLDIVLSMEAMNEDFVTAFLGVRPCRRLPDPGKSVW